MTTKYAVIGYSLMEGEYPVAFDLTEEEATALVKEQIETWTRLNNGIPPKHPDRIQSYEDD